MANEERSNERYRYRFRGVRVTVCMVENGVESNLQEKTTFVPRGATKTVTYEHLQRIYRGFRARTPLLLRLMGFTYDRRRKCKKIAFLIVRGIPRQRPRVPSDGIVVKSEDAEE